MSAFRDLEPALKAEADKAQSSLRRLTQRETHLRNVLQDLQRREMQGAKQGDLGYRATGADLLWAKWVSRQRSKLNTELARIMAQKTREIANSKTAFSRHQAVLELLRKDVSVHRNARAKAETEALLELCRDVGRP